MRQTGAQRLLKWRLAVGWTQRQLAEKLATDTTRISQWENGAVPSLAYAVRLAEISRDAVPVAAWMPEA